MAAPWLAWKRMSFQPFAACWQQQSVAQAGQLAFDAVPRQPEAQHPSVIYTSRTYCTHPKCHTRLCDRVDSAQQQCTLSR